MVGHLASDPVEYELRPVYRRLDGSSPGSRRSSRVWPAQGALATAQTNYRSAASAAKEYEALIYSAGTPNTVSDPGPLDNV